jgi:hypothetical protein
MAHSDLVEISGNGLPADVTILNMRLKWVVLMIVMLSGCCKGKDNQAPSAAGSASAAGSGSGAGSGSSTQLTLKPCKKPHGSGCNTATCGGNSALINAFPIDGVRPDGECSDLGVQLVPGSLVEACKDMTLDLEGDKLVGRGADGSICSDIKGATFEVRTWNASARIAITDIVDYPVPNGGGETVTAYRMEWTDEAANDNGKRRGLCGKEGENLRTALKLRKMKFRDDLPAVKAELIIPVNSELYDELGEPIPTGNWQVKKPEWIQFACVDDALAKRKMYHQQTSDVSRNRAALRMWTADYCGSLPVTMRGKWIDWSNSQGLEVEAQWTEKGASCLSAPRILRKDGKEFVPEPKDVTKRVHHLCTKCKSCDCKTIVGWMKAITTCFKEDDETVDHLIPKCTTPCTTPECLFESRNVKKDP